MRLSDVGVAGDRSFGVLDVASQTIISAKRDGRLLEATARFSGQELLVGAAGRDELGPGYCARRPSLRVARPSA